MARIFSDMSAAGPSSVEWAFLCLLQLLLEHLCRPHRRGCLHGRFQLEDSFGSAADQSLVVACNRHHEDNTTGQISSRALCPFHPALSTFNVDEEDAADQIGASWNSRMAMFNRLHDLMRRIRLTATISRADRPCTWACRRDAGDDTTGEGSGDNFHGIDIACNSPYVEENTCTASRKRATTNRHRTMSESDRLTYSDVELYTSTCPDDRYRSLGYGQYSTSNDLVRLCRNIARHERDYPRRIYIDHGNLWDNWSRRSWWFTTGDLDFSELFSEHRSRQLWPDNSSEEISVQDDDSLDWRKQSCTDSVDRSSESYDNLCLDQSSVCTSDSDSDADCSETLHGTVTTSTELVNYVLPCSVDSNTVASSSTQLRNSSSDEASILTAEQPDSSDDMDDCDSSNNSLITAEHLLARQRDSNENVDVSMAQEQASETPNGSDDGTRSTPWWLIPGFRFLPTDKEIVLFYLKQKVLNLGLPAHHPVEEGHNIYALDANEITLDGINGDKERLGFFFVQKQDSYTYGNGCYYPTPDGYWRIRGRPAGVRRSGRTIAFKTSMDFYRGRPPHGCRTPWSMFEYALNACQFDLWNFEQPWMNSYVVCKVRKRESETSSREEERWRRPGLLLRRPLLKKIAPRCFRPWSVVLPKKNVALKLKEELPALEQDDEERGVLGKRKRSDTF